MILRKARFLLVALGLAALVAGCSDPEQRAAKYIQSGIVITSYSIHYTKLYETAW